MTTGYTGPQADQALAPGAVHVWYDRLRPGQEDRRRIAARATVPETELERCARFRHEDGRQECLAARHLVRTVLSSYDPGVAPAAWQFGANAFGRPFVAAPLVPTPLRFNLTHAGGLIACVVSRTLEVGIDVEPIGRRTPLAVAESRFAPTEHDALARLPLADRPRRFLEYWTLKEAYIKARGTGLSLGLDHFAFDLAAPARPRITFAPGFDDDPAHWQFDLVVLDETFLMAVATRTRGAGPVSLNIRPLPLVDAVS